MTDACRICAARGCPRITESSHCPEHARAKDRARGTKTERGYGKEFQAERKVWVRMVAEGVVNCWRCLKLIPPDGDFHLGHDENDRTVIRGPECPSCNLSAAGKASHR